MSHYLGRLHVSDLVVCFRSRRRHSRRWKQDDILEKPRHQEYPTRELLRRPTLTISRPRPTTSPAGLARVQLHQAQQILPRLREFPSYCPFLSTSALSMRPDPKEPQWMAEFPTMVDASQRSRDFCCLPLLTLFCFTHSPIRPEHDLPLFALPLMRHR